MHKNILDFGVWQTYRAQVQLWNIRFNEGLEDVNHNARRGRPRAPTTYENIKAVKMALILNYPKLLNFEHNQRRMDYAQEILTT